MDGKEETDAQVAWIRLGAVPEEHPQAAVLIMKAYKVVLAEAPYARGIRATLREALGHMGWAPRLEHSLHQEPEDGFTIGVKKPA